MNREIPSWFNEDLQNDMRALIPRFSFQIQKAYEKNELWSFLNIEEYQKNTINQTAFAYLFLELVNLGYQLSIDDQTKQELSFFCEQALLGYSRLASSSREMSDGYKAKYLLSTQGVDIAYSFISRRQIDEGYLEVAKQMIFEGRYEEAEKTLNLVDPQKNLLTEPLFIAIACLQLNEKPTMHWGEFREKYLSALHEKSSKNFLTRYFIQFATQRKTIDPQMASEIAYRQDSELLLLQVESDLILQSTHRTDPQAVGEMYSFKSWMKGEIIGVNADTEQKIQLLCQVIKEFGALDSHFALELFEIVFDLLEEEKKAAERESFIAERRVRPSLGPFVEALKAAISLNAKELQERLKKEISENAGRDLPFYWEEIALAYYDFDQEESHRWWRSIWQSSQYFPVRYILKSLEDKQNFDQVLHFIYSGDRGESHMDFWSEFTRLAMKLGHPTWKETLKKLPIAYQVYVCRDLISEMKRESMKLPEMYLGI